MARHRPRLTLLHLLIAPFAVLVLALAAALATLSWQAGARSVQAAALQGLGETVRRIGDLLDEQALQADRLTLALMAAQGPWAGDGTEGDDDALRQRWTALLAQAPAAAHGVSLIAPGGGSASLRRLSATEFEWQRRAPDGASSSPQALHGGAPDVRAAGAAPPPPDLLPRSPGPVVVAASGATGGAAGPSTLAAIGGTWAALRADAVASGLIWPRVRAGAPVATDSAAPAAGGPVVALEWSLAGLDAVLRQRISGVPGAVAYIVEHDGRLVASTATVAVRRQADGSLQRVMLTATGHQTLAALHLQVQPNLGGSSRSRPGELELDLGESGRWLASFARWGNGVGQDWALVVAAPRQAYTAGLSRSLAHMAAAALVALALILLAGALVKRRLSTDARELSHVALRAADGDLETPPRAMLTAEFDALSESLARMQQRLRTDRVGGLANREAVLTRLHDRMRPGRRLNDAPLLALLYVDLDGFREVNQRHGPEAGDVVLLTLGRRLRQAVRETDIVARWTSDEFVLLLDGVASPANAEQVRNQVERLLRDPIPLGERRPEAELGGTAGLAIYPGDASDPDDLLRAAEDDMARRKSDAAGAL